MESAGLRIALRIWVGVVLLLLFTPIVLIIVYAFGPSVVQTAVTSSTASDAT